MNGGTLRVNGGLVVVPDNAVVATVPGAYPYTTVAADREIAVDSAGGARTIVLEFALSEHELVVCDTPAAAATHNITVSVASGKKLNGSADGTVTIATSGAMRGFKRNALGEWIGGV